jgi:hypothetical protein
MFKGKYPDITPAFALAIIGWFASQLVAYGWLDDETKALFLSGASTVVAIGAKIADAYLRGKRNEAEALKAAAGRPSG